SPKNFERLKRNVEINEFKNVVLTNAAISDAAGTAVFREKGSAGKLAENSNKTIYDIEVKKMRLDDFAKDNPVPQLLIIDTEGHAGGVLRGAVSLLQSKPTVLCEVHNPQELSEV